MTPSVSVSRIRLWVWLRILLEKSRSFWRSVCDWRRPRNIEHEAAVLQDVAGLVAHRETVHENVNRRSILAAEDFFLIVQSALALEQFRQFLPALGRKINLGGNVELNDLFAAAVAEDANQRVVDFHKAALGRGEENSFLNVVEEFAIAALGFAAVGDVLEHVHGLPLGAARSCFAPAHRAKPARWGLRDGGMYARG